MGRVKRYIALDLGAETSRCAVVTLENHRVALENVHRFPTFYVGYEKGMYWDILAIYREIIKGLTKIRKAFGTDFEGIGVDAWGVDYVLLDSEQRIISYPYHYRDGRTESVMKRVLRRIAKKDIYGTVGIQFVQFNTLFQLLSEKERATSFLQLANKMLLIPDFINLLLSGKMKAEFSVASTTSLADPVRRDWAWGLIDRFELPRKLFPEMVQPGTVLGNLLPLVAKKTGLRAGTPVIATSGHDTASAVASMPAGGDTNWAFLSSGTWSLMGIELDKPLLSSRAMTHNFTNEGGVMGTTRFLKNIAGLWPLQESKRYWAERSKNFSYKSLVDIARKEKPVNAWIDLDDNRFFKAGEMPNKVQDFLRETGQPHRSDIGFLVRVILESLAFHYRKTLKEIENVTDKKVALLHVVGGGVKNPLLMQLASDALARKVCAGPSEGTIIGNAGTQAIATGAVSGLEEWRGIVADSFRLKIYLPRDAGYFENNKRAFEDILRD